MNTIEHCHFKQNLKNSIGSLTAAGQRTGEHSILYQHSDAIIITSLRQEHIKFCSRYHALQIKTFWRIMKYDPASVQYQNACRYCCRRKTFTHAKYDRKATAEQTRQSSGSGKQAVTDAQSLQLSIMCVCPDILCYSPPLPHSFVASTQ